MQRVTLVERPPHEEQDTMLDILRRMTRRKVHTGLTVLGVAVGVFTLTVMGAMAEKLNPTGQGPGSREGAGATPRGGAHGWTSRCEVGRHIGAPDSCRACMAAAVSIQLA